MPTTTRPLLNMMDHVYRIRNWHDHFETSESRKVRGALSWVPVPTKHDGRGYKRVSKLPHGPQALAGWWSMLQVAAKMPIRGLLADRDGPLDAEDIADKTNLPKKIYVTALAVMSEEKIGWLESLPWDQNLDFAGNTAALIASQHLPADTSASQRISADTSARQRKKKDQSFHGNTSADQQPPADTSAKQHTPAQNSADQQPPAHPSPTVHNSTVQDIPPTVPQGGQEAAPIGFEEAKNLLNQLFGREKRKWSFEEDDLLSKAIPITRAEWPLIAAWFRLPAEHPVFEVTKRKQELTTFLRDFNGELDKIRRHAPIFFQPSANGSAQKKEPARWRELFRWLHGPEIHLPPSFGELDRDQKSEYEREFAKFSQANPDKQE